jgi:hypothetical protein
MPPKRSTYYLLQYHLWSTTLMLQDFQINSPYGRFGEHPPQGRWKIMWKIFNIIKRSALYSLKAHLGAALPVYETVSPPTSKALGAIPSHLGKDRMKRLVWENHRQASVRGRCTTVHGRILRHFRY